MNDCKTLGPWIRRYLDDYALSERNLATNTRRSYGDTFRLLLPFLSSKVRKPIDRLTFDHLTADRLRVFLGHIEVERGNSVRTRNRRLAAVRAFARFVASRELGLIEWCGQIRSISLKRAAAKSVTWLNRTETEILLATPDRTTPGGRTEYAILLFLVNSGARVSEATELQIRDLEFSQRNSGFASVTLHGKGGKVRQCPLWTETEQVLADLVAGRSSSDPVFLSRYGQAYTRQGIYRVVERCAAAVPELSAKKITPHVLRHTAACNLVRANVDTNTIRAWLGHVNIKTTNIYIEIDLEMKVRAMELCDPVGADQRRPWKDDKGVMAFLNSL